MFPSAHFRRAVWITSHFNDWETQQNYMEFDVDKCKLITPKCKVCVLIGCHHINHMKLTRMLKISLKSRERHFTENSIFSVEWFYYNISRKFPIPTSNWNWNCNGLFFYLKQKWNLTETDDDVLMKCTELRWK